MGHPQVQLFVAATGNRRAQAEAYATGLEGEDLEVALAGEDYA